MRRADCDQHYTQENYPNSSAQDKVTEARNEGRETKMHATAEVQGTARGVQNNAVMMNREGETGAKVIAEREEKGRYSHVWKRVAKERMKNDRS